MKSYLLTIFMCLLIGQAVCIVPVFARPADPERFPQVQPLLPPAYDTAPNYKGNINSELNDFSPAASGEENEQVKDPSLVSLPRAAAKTQSNFILWTLSVLALGALGYWGYRKSRTPG